LRARANTALAFFSLSPNHLFSIVEASMARKVAPPDNRDVDSDMMIKMMIMMISMMMVVLMMMI